MSLAHVTWCLKKTDIGLNNRKTDDILVRLESEKTDFIMVLYFNGLLIVLINLKYAIPET